MARLGLTNVLAHNLIQQSTLPKTTCYNLEPIRKIKFVWCVVRGAAAHNAPHKNYWIELNVARIVPAPVAEGSKLPEKVDK